MRAKGDATQEDTGSLLRDVARTYARVFNAWQNEGSLFSLIIAEAEHDDGVAETLTTFRKERIADWLPALQRAEKRGELVEDPNLKVMAESIVAHAWFYLLTKRLDADTTILAANVVRPWLRERDKR